VQKTRLFSSLVLFGASLTGGAVATIATVSVLTVSGCDNSSDDTSEDMSFGHYPDIGLAPGGDLSSPTRQHD
jgi:hypothetical protein